MEELEEDGMEAIKVYAWIRLNSGLDSDWVLERLNSCVDSGCLWVMRDEVWLNRAHPIS
ncbi:hypothetical protein HDU92_003445 [Lobulomyces angularis]|nr:hypothetical protein HDU92_003445 [Lobulomyces angularis]